MSVNGGQIFFLFVFFTKNSTSSCHVSHSNTISLDFGYKAPFKHSSSESKGRISNWMIVKYRKKGIWGKSLVFQEWETATVFTDMPDWAAVINHMTKMKIFKVVVESACITQDLIQFVLQIVLQKWILISNLVRRLRISASMCADKLTS